MYRFAQRRRSNDCVHRINRKTIRPLDGTDSSTLFVAYVVLKCLQNVATALVFILYAYVVTALWRKQVYHSNLIVLLMALPVSSLVAVVMTLALDVLGALDLLFSPLVGVINFAVKFGMFGGALNLPNFIVERLAATLLVDKYEKCNDSFPFFSTTLVLIQRYDEVKGAHVQ